MNKSKWLTKTKRGKRIITALCPLCTLGYLHLIQILVIQEHKERGGLRCKIDEGRKVEIAGTES